MYMAPDESGSYKSSCSGGLCPVVILKGGTVMRDQIRRVLIAEDDSYDIKPLRRAFKKRPAWEIAVVYDGAEALDYLFKYGKYTDAWRSGLFIKSLRWMPLSLLRGGKRRFATGESACCSYWLHVLARINPSTSETPVA